MAINFWSKCVKNVWNGIYIHHKTHTIRVFKNFHTRAGYSTFYRSRPPGIRNECGWDELIPKEILIRRQNKIQELSRQPSHASQHAILTQVSVVWLPQECLRIHLHLEMSASISEMNVDEMNSSPKKFCYICLISIVLKLKSLHKSANSESVRARTLVKLDQMTRNDPNTFCRPALF